ncbi:putative ferric-chelate reductase 1 [Pseudochaenichthys georgianus]|uniref:putative ferric-chelate reductase 1 n=1 Tax=Pseudochaenichthys georgianus TaxID=52239 RepID=UPI00146A3717|nr:putative ferric-chelate reductase 1 [Pseudochaenichthys georgianus]
MTPINRADCGTGQLCAAEPSDCDPSTSSSCFFLSAKQNSGRNFDIGLSGESDGYLAATLSLDNILGGNDTTYVCANKNGVVKFFGAVLNNGKLTLRELPVDSVKGKITGKKIQCSFSATVPAQITRVAQFAVAISTGTFNSSTDALGDPSTQLKSPLVNLENPNTTVTNELATNTSSHAITIQQSLTQALLFTVGVLGLTVL